MCESSSRAPCAARSPLIGTPHTSQGRDVLVSLKEPRGRPAAEHTEQRRLRRLGRLLGGGGVPIFFFFAAFLPGMMWLMLLCWWCCCVCVQSAALQSTSRKSAAR